MRSMVEGFSGTGRTPPPHFVRSPSPANAGEELSSADGRRAPEGGWAAHQLLEFRHPRRAAAELKDERRLFRLFLPVNLQRLRQAPAPDQFLPAVQQIFGLGEGTDEVLLPVRLLEAADGEVADGEARGPGRGEQAGDVGSVEQGGGGRA